ncbi:MAG: nitrite reductase small subunit NirD [Candidatus Omnitrophica bacterium]|nr:nitrite reductase small subunit NirD [Candidatus Omnitrophota bacterium]
MWQKVATISEIEEGQAKPVDAGGKPVALFKVEGQFYALDNTCPHRGGPLGEGYLKGTEVTCPWHAWTFDVKTGACQGIPGVKQATFPVKIEGDDVLVDV